MYLTKYIAHAGLCSRRKALELIKQGLIQVNSKVETDPAYLVQPNDQVQYKSTLLNIIKKPIYILLNKPTDCLSSCADLQGRATVLDYVQVPEARLYPIGRLDKQTTGVLLITNDGQLAYTLSHPRFEVPKIYAVTLDKPFKQLDATRLRMGIELEDGFIVVDQIKVDKRNAKQVVVHLHSGRNRIVRRMFAHLGYHVQALDRISFAGITHKGLKQGKWRFLTATEIQVLRLLKK